MIVYLSGERRAKQTPLLEQDATSYYTARRAKGGGGGGGEDSLA